MNDLFQRMHSQETRNDARPSSPPHQALRRFRLIFKAMQQHSQWVESHCGVSGAQLWALWEMSDKPGIRVTELAENMSIHQSTASNLLLKLTKKGLAKRERDHQDQRVVSLYLTDAGREILAKAQTPARGILQHALFQLPEEVLHDMARTLDILIGEMNISDREAEMEPISPLGKPRKKSDSANL
jgi:DNA-binding MarR family transcriptional regulator